MSAPIHVIGIGADGRAGLRSDQVERIVSADFLAGGARHLDYFPETRGARFVLRDNIRELVAALTGRYERQRCVVLASGDPLFFGVGKRLAESLGRAHVRFEPALSSMQLAFARAGLAWDSAALASIHGRDLRATLLPLLGKGLIGLFTHDGDTPAAVARFFLERDAPAYQAIVGENLGAADERVTPWATLRELAGQQFAPLNYLILSQRTSPEHSKEIERHRALVPGAPDETFARPKEGPEVMTRQEVRAVALAKLLRPTQPGDTVWDIGAGLGTVAVELAVLRPDVEVIAVERDAARAAYLRQNRERFGAYNIRLIEGAAPECIAEEAEPPRLVFVGGSAGRLAALLTFVAERLREGGRLVASFVTLEHLALALEHVRRLGWQFEVTEIHVARSDRLAGLTGLKPLRGVFLLAADKPEQGSPVPVP
ncbi:MAG: precorrin-6y C5,15-methyltransferase (decarboxylating) subunit CbiE [Gemmataceae bacterium]|nr:precorrin-6y C5,15-methyltransferase (decarboxylating) subunit CbiE [Gemmataceae bacterium]